MIANTTRYGRRAARKEVMSRRWKHVWVCLMGGSCWDYNAKVLIAQVETQLKSGSDKTDVSRPDNTTRSISFETVPSFSSTNNGFVAGFQDASGLPIPIGCNSFFDDSTPPLPRDASLHQFPGSFNFEETLNWDIIALGLEEPLPSEDAIAELYALLSFLHDCAVANMYGFV